MVNNTPENKRDRKIRGKVTVAGSRINIWHPVGLADILRDLEIRRGDARLLAQTDVEVFTFPSLRSFQTTDIYSDALVRSIRSYNQGYEVVVDDAEYVLFRGRTVEAVPWGAQIVPPYTSYDNLQFFNDQVGLDAAQREARKALLEEGIIHVPKERRYTRKSAS